MIFSSDNENSKYCIIVETFVAAVLNGLHYSTAFECLCELR